MVGKLLVLAFLLSCMNSILSLRLLYTNHKDIRLLWTNRKGANERVVANGLESAVGVDFHFKEQRIFWTDVSEEKIFGCFLRTCIKPTTIVSTGLVRPEGLAVDWVTRKIYWTDSNLKLIEVTNFDGSYRKTLVWENIDNPRAIAVDPAAGYIFWSDWGDTPKISRAGMDGSSKTDLITTLISWPNGLTLDYTDKRLYWLDAQHKYIASVDYNGKGRQMTYSGAVNHPYALTLLNDQLFWTDWATDSIRSCRISKQNKSRDAFVVKSGIYSPTDLKIFEIARQPNVSYNPCDNENGGCSHLCLLAPNGRYSCACPTGVALSTDNKTCENGPQKFLLLTRSNEIRLLSLSTPQHRDVELPLKNIGNAVAVEFDLIDRFVYWIDSQFNEIKRAYLNGSDEVVLVKIDLHTPEGLAVDSIGRMLYWTDAGTDRIETCHLNGSRRRVVLADNLDEPRAIVVDPKNHYVYWSDWGANPKLERAYIDGRNREVLINTSIQWPNGLVLDHTARKLYWADAKLDKIEVCGLTGADRTIITRKGISHIFGFTLVGNYLYWTDLARNVLGRMHKNNSLDREVIKNIFGDTMALKGVDLQLNI